MVKPPITDVAIRQLKPTSGAQIELWDGMIKGFGVRVSPEGTKAFVLLYRHARKSRRLTIGRYPGLGLAQARQLAAQALTQLAAGTDPQEARQQRRMAERTNAFPALLDEFVETHCKRHNKPSTARETERILRNDFLELWRQREVKSLNKSDVLRRLDTLVRDGTPSAANHAYAAVRKFFNWAVERGHIVANPCTGLTSPAKATKRERVLTEAELIKVWQAASKIGYPCGTIVQLLILTAQRRGEVAGVRWSDLDLTAKTWTQPAELTKNGRAHTIPITAVAEKILLTLPKTGLLVFPARRSDAAYGGFGQAKMRFDEMTGFSNWTFHDLRRTAATGMAGLRVSPHVVERVLNHASGSFAGVAGVYNRFQYLAEMREALETWENHVTCLVNGSNTMLCAPSLLHPRSDRKVA